MKYTDITHAEQIKNSIEMDNPEFIKTELLGNIINVNITAKSFMNLLHTLEDYLSCLSTAENVIIGCDEKSKKEQKRFQDK